MTEAPIETVPEQGRGILRARHVELVRSSRVEADDRRGGGLGHRQGRPQYDAAVVQRVGRRSRSRCGAAGCARVDRAAGDRRGLDLDGSIHCARAATPARHRSRSLHRAGVCALCGSRRILDPGSDPLRGGPRGRHRRGARQRSGRVREGPGRPVRLGVDPRECGRIRAARNPSACDRGRRLHRWLPDGGTGESRDTSIPVSAAGGGARERAAPRAD